jgi:hypothetical protein
MAGIDRPRFFQLSAVAVQSPVSAPLAHGAMAISSKTLAEHFPQSNTRFDSTSLTWHIRQPPRNTWTAAANRECNFLTGNVGNNRRSTTAGNCLDFDIHTGRQR